MTVDQKTNFPACKKYWKECFSNNRIAQSGDIAW